MRIGIDLGGTKTEGILMDAAGNIVERQRRPTPQENGYEAVLDNIAGLVRHLEAIAGQPCRVGVASPGALSPATGLLRNSNTVCMNGQPVLEDLQSLLQREIRIANDANCFTLSEAVDGAAAGARVVFGIIIGTGTGGGIVIDGKPLAGLQNIAGEWGHNPLGSERRRCYCGRNDCVETYLSGPGLVKSWNAAGGKPGKTAADIAGLADRQDPAALRVMETYIDHFARALASVINILDPDVVVLGGGLSNIDRLYTDLPGALETHVFSDTMYTRIVRNRHGDSSGVRGAAWLWDTSG